MKVILIRHGKTAANEQHLYCGSTDLSLSPGGREELGKLHYEVGSVRFATSGMKRTEETLKLLFGERPHEILPGFREVDFGIFEMGSYQQLKDDPAYQAWITGDNEKNVPPGGESGETMTKRVLTAWKAVEETGEDWVIVTHGGVIAAILQALFPEEGKTRYQWQSAPGRGYCLTTENGVWAYAPLTEAGECTVVSDREKG